MATQTKSAPKRQATEADKALLASILKTAKPYVELKSKSAANRPSWEQQQTIQKVEELTEGQADYVLVDTKRQPAQVTWSSLPQLVTWHVCRSLAEFQAYIKAHGMPRYLSVDYDLTPPDTKTTVSGKDLAEWLTKHCVDNKTPLPQWNCHSKSIVNVQAFEAYMFSAIAKVKKALAA